MQKKYFFYFLGLNLFLWLTSCSTLQPVSHHLSDSNHWVARGQFAITMPTQKVNASYFWQQQGDDYQIRFFGPLGLGAVVLKGQPNKVTLTNVKGQQLTADSPETLLQQTLGWSLPVSDLRYWLWGLPAPHHSFTPIKQQERLIQLNQEGWQINYLDYFSDSSRPRLLVCSRKNMTIRIVVN